MKNKLIFMGIALVISMEIPCSLTAHRAFVDFQDIEAPPVLSKAIWDSAGDVAGDIDKEKKESKKDDLAKTVQAPQKTESIIESIFWHPYVISMAIAALSYASGWKAHEMKAEQKCTCKCPGIDSLFDEGGNAPYSPMDNQVLDQNMLCPIWPQEFICSPNDWWKDETKKNGMENGVNTTANSSQQILQNETILNFIPNFSSVHNASNNAFNSTALQDNQTNRINADNADLENNQPGFWGEYWGNLKNEFLPSPPTHFSSSSYQKAVDAAASIFYNLYNGGYGSMTPGGKN